MGARRPGVGTSPAHAGSRPHQLNVIGGAREHPAEGRAGVRKASIHRRLTLPRSGTYVGR
jgi:hypothetical protein